MAPRSWSTSSAAEVALQLAREVLHPVAQDLGAGYDLVLFTCKAYDLDSAMEAIAPAVAGDAAVVPMLNGMAHFERLDVRFGRDRVMGGTCQINVMLRNDGTVFHADPLQRILFGERDKSVSARAQAFADALRPTKIDWKLSPDIEQDLWEKIVFLCALASTTCLFRANVREIMAAVREPTGRLPGRGEDEEWYLTDRALPRLWVQVVVHYDGGGGWIVTAFPRESPPRR